MDKGSRVWALVLRKNRQFHIPFTFSRHVHLEHESCLGHYLHASVVVVGRGRSMLFDSTIKEHRPFLEVHSGTVKKDGLQEATGL